MHELLPFITDADLQSAALALKVATQCLHLQPQTPEVQDLIARASNLANSQLIQGSTLSELLVFVGECAKCGDVKDQTISTIYNYVSLDT